MSRGRENLEFNSLLVNVKLIGFYEEAGPSEWVMKRGLGAWLSGQSTYLIQGMPWVQFAAPHKPNMAWHAYDSSHEDRQTGGSDV